MSAAARVLALRDHAGLAQAEVHGIDISRYAVENAKEEVRPFLRVGDAKELPFPDQHFDLVVSINALHNLYIDELWSALRRSSGWDAVRNISPSNRTVTSAKR